MYREREREKEKERERKGEMANWGTHAFDQSQKGLGRSPRFFLLPASSPSAAVRRSRRKEGAVSAAARGLERRGRLEEEEGRGGRNAPATLATSPFFLTCPNRTVFSLKFWLSFSGAVAEQICSQQFDHTVLVERSKWEERAASAKVWFCTEAP